MAQQAQAQTEQPTEETTTITPSEGAQAPEGEQAPAGQEQPAPQGETGEPKTETKKIEATIVQSPAEGDTAQGIEGAAAELEQAAQDLSQADQETIEQARSRAQQALDGVEQALQEKAGDSDATENIQGQVQSARQQLQDEPQAAAETLRNLAESARSLQQSQELQRQQADIPAEADRIIGKKLVSEQGEEIGEISNVLVTTDGQVEAVLIKQGGALGMGGRQVALTWDQMQLQGDQLTVALTPEEVEQLPEYQAD
jgi:sporulation protein YlmC with PRC-barrel domain